METRVRALIAQLEQETSLKKIRKILNVEYDIKHNYGFHKTKEAIMADKISELCSKEQPGLHIKAISEILAQYLNADSMAELLEISKTDSDGMVDACINLIEHANCNIQGQDLNKEEALVAEATMAIMILHYEYSIPFDAFRGFA